MANEPASRDFDEAGTGIMAWIYPSLYYHKLYNHSYPEIAQYLDNIENSNVSAARKEYEKNATMRIVRSAKYINAQYVVAFCAILFIVLFFCWIAGFIEFKYAALFIVPLGIALVHYNTLERSTDLYFKNFNVAHKNLHGKEQEMRDLAEQERLDYPQSKSNNGRSINF